MSENKKNGTAYKNVIIEIRAINKISFNASLNKKNKEKNKEKIEVQIISFNLIEILKGYKQQKKKLVYAKYPVL